MAMRGPEVADRRLVHYYAETARCGPSDLLLRALAHAGGSHALDLGCGVGRDALPLCRRGYSVLAIDHAPSAIAALRLLRVPGLTTRFADFRRTRIGVGCFDLVHASMSLPFAGPDALPSLMRRLDRSLRPSGVLSFHLFGKKHQFNRPNSGVAFHRRDEVEALVAGLEILELEERRPVRGFGLHVFQVIVRATERARPSRRGRGSSRSGA